MQINFDKMEGAGNDFVVIDATREPQELSAAACRHIADRRRGVGCDQLLVIEPARDSDTDFYYRIFNSDGSEAEQCGNGVRCVARFIHEHALSSKKYLVLGSPGGKIETELLDELPGGSQQVQVNMGAPRFEPADIPLDAGERSLSYRATLEGHDIEFGAVSMGNPHAVLKVSDLENTPVADLGEMLESHALFPRRANIGFMQKLAPDHVRLRVFERGVGETLACGTGACAAAVWGMLAGELASEVKVDLPGGRLMISWDGMEKGEDTPVYMTGPANTVFTGRIDLAAELY